MEDGAEETQVLLLRQRIDALETQAREKDAVIQTLETQALAKHAALEQLQETLHAVKLAQEQQVAELNAKDLLLERKNERIDQLVSQLRDQERQVDAKGREAEAFRTQMDALHVEVHELRDHLEQDEQDFTMLRAAMDAKDDAVVKKQQELTHARETEANLTKEIDRLQTIIRRLEKNVDELHPDTADACLSPRSFHENQLIQLRDDAIQAKTKEVWLLMGQNDQLRVQLDQLEAEMDRLQTSFLAKENEVARKERKIEKLQNELEALLAARQQAEGREKAFEISTTQNAKLLQALQAQEAVCEDLQQRLEHAEAECAMLRHNQKQFLEQSAVNEVEVLQKTKQVEEKSSVVTALQEKLTRERRELHQELSDTRLKYQLETEKLQSELVMRRNKQYELTLKLQETEGKLHTATDELETTTEQLMATHCRMEEADRVLRESLEWKHKLENELAIEKRKAATAQAEHDASVQKAMDEADGLRSQLRELKDSLLKHLDLEKKKDVQIRDLKKNVDARDQLVQEQKERISRLVQELNRESKARVEVEMERTVAREQLESVRSEMQRAIRDCLEQNRQLEDKIKAAHSRFEQLETEYAKEQSGKSRLVFKYADALRHIAIDNARIWTSTWDLKDLWLADQDLAPLLSTLECAPTSVVRVDLRSNRLTQDGMKLLLHFFRKRVTKAMMTLREVDVRQNFVSIDGIRTLASGLETLETIKRVLVRQNGRIECFPSPSSGMEPALVIDITNNAHPDALIAHLRKLHRRKPRDEGDDHLPPQENNQQSVFTPSRRTMTETSAAAAASPLLQRTPSLSSSTPSPLQMQSPSSRSTASLPKLL